MVIVDSDQGSVDVRDALRRMDAFIVKSCRAVYLMSQSEVLRGALKGWSLYDHILATVIWHEMAHTEGADEVEAQRREEALLMTYIIAEHVDRDEGMRYLAILRDRRGKDGKLAHRQENAEMLNGRVLEQSIAVVERMTPSIHP